MNTDEASERHKRCLGDSVPSKIKTLRLQTKEWNDWKWQIKNRMRSVKDIESDLGVFVEDGIDKAADKFPLAITPYYASLIKSFDSSDPVYLMSVPSVNELIDPSYLVEDPLGEENDSPVEGLVHRYNDRALIVSTSMCAMLCRHCTRKRVTGQTEHCFGSSELQGWINYLQDHPEIKDVIVSGGDPFTMETSKIDELLTAIRSVESVETIRVGTRTPVVLPMRIDYELTNMLRKHHPIWINTHFNHPNEITPESEQAVIKLVDAGIPVGNQSVLLKGVNDDPSVMEKLCRMLVRMRVRPYYMFVADKVVGTNHFQTTIEVGLNIISYLTKNISGIAVPSLVVDLPDGGGKVRLLPNQIIDRHEETIHFPGLNEKTIIYHNG